MIYFGFESGETAGILCKILRTNANTIPSWPHNSDTIRLMSLKDGSFFNDQEAIH